ncbi:unnamed protein product [Brassica rapa subsp. narinosa]
MNVNGGVELEETASDANDTISLAVSNAPAAFADDLRTRWEQLPP